MDYVHYDIVLLIQMIETCIQQDQRRLPYLVARILFILLLIVY